MTLKYLTGVGGDVGTCPAPSLALISWGAFEPLGAFASVYSSIGAVCEGNTDTISSRQVSVGLISGGPRHTDFNDSPAY